MHNCLRRGNRPEAVTEEQRIGDQQKHRNPQQRRHSNRGPVGAGKHQVLSSDGRTTTASFGENSSSSSPCQFSRVAVRSDNFNPSAHSTCKSSEWHRTTPPFASPCNKLVCPMNCAVYAVAGCP